MKNKTPQKQFKSGTVPHEPAMSNSMDNREAGGPSRRRARNNVALGFQAPARPGVAGIISRHNRNIRGR